MEHRLLPPWAKGCTFRQQKVRGTMERFVNSLVAAEFFTRKVRIVVLTVLIYAAMC
jgi:hypothetical protein